MCQDAGAKLGGQTLAGVKVLLASSQERATAICCEHLRCAGAEAVVATSAQAALEQYRELLANGTAPFAVIADQCLADYDADWLAQAIRACGAPPPALLLMRSLSRSSAQGNEQVFDRVLNKPVKPEVLLRALGELSQSIVALPTMARGVGDPVLNPGVRVLVVDDNAVNQKVVTHFLRKLGAVVFSAGNGIEALDALHLRHFDVVLMDCQMPDMDGYEATRRLRQFEPTHRNRNIPVIALTANALATDREKCVAAGMNHYLSKPIDRQRLEQALALALGGAKPSLIAEAPRAAS
jgi:CheY-like chemotaxis protein